MRISSQEEQNDRKKLKAKRDEWISMDQLEHAETVHVGLVGGSDLASIAVRQAQSILRFDKRPAYFSHAFIFSGYGRSIWECPVVNADPRQPEKNGVRKASADDYADQKKYPNRALISFRFDSKATRKTEILNRAKSPNKSVERVDLWSLVTDWQPHIFDSQRHGNPLIHGLSHPGAMFVHWALAAGGIDVTLGAVDPLHAPEHIWAAANWWSERYAGEDFGVTITIHEMVNQKDLQYPPA